MIILSVAVLVSISLILENGTIVGNQLDFVLLCSASFKHALMVDVPFP